MSAQFSSGAIRREFLVAQKQEEENRRNYLIKLALEREKPTNIIAYLEKLSYVILGLSISIAFALIIQP